MRIIDLHEQRAAYAAVMEELANSKEPIVLERDGKPAAVVVPYELYRQLTHAPASATAQATGDQAFERNSDADESALLERVYAKYGYGSLYIPRVEEPEHVYRIRGPRLPRK